MWPPVKAGDVKNYPETFRLKLCCGSFWIHGREHFFHALLKRADHLYLCRSTGKNSCDWFACSEVTSDMRQIRDLRLLCLIPGGYKP